MPHCCYTACNIRFVLTSMTLFHSWQTERWHVTNIAAHVWGPHNITLHRMEPKQLKLTINYNRIYYSWANTLNNCPSTLEIYIQMSVKSLYVWKTQRNQCCQLQSKTTEWWVTMRYLDTPVCLAASHRTPDASSHHACGLHERHPSHGNHVPSKQ